MSAPSLRSALTAAALFASIAFAAPSAHAQQIFVTSNTTISTDVSGNDIFVGKDNLTDFNTLPGTITLTLADGAVTTEFVSSDPSGNVYQGVGVFGTHIANIVGGSIGNTASFESATINITGGTVAGSLSSDNSTVNVRGGIVDHTYADENSTINIYGGTVTDMVFGTLTSNINIYGGNVGVVVGFRNSAIVVSGGSVGDIDLHENSLLSLFGGDIGTDTIRLFDSSILNIYGSGLGFSSAGTGSDGDGSYSRYTLSGMLSNGQSIDGVTLRDYDGGLSIGNPNAGTGNLRFSSSVVAPEPASASLALITGLPLLGALTNVRRKRRP